MVGSPSGLPAAPAMFLHKATGQTVVKLSGRFVYLGAFGSEEAEQRYRRVVGEFQATGGVAVEQVVTVDHVIAGYWRHAEVYYRKNGKPTSELSVLRLAMRPLHALCVSLVTAALDMAVEGRRPVPGSIFHSDRGSQYACPEFRAALKAKGFVPSMSRRGDCYDNAAAESLHHSLKTECVFLQDYKTRDEALAIVFDYIELFYNRQRMHSSIGYRSPVEFEVAHAG